MHRAAGPADAAGRPRSSSVTAADRRVTDDIRLPDRRYADRRQANTLRAVIDKLLESGRLELVESGSEREFRPVRREPPEDT